MREDSNRMVAYLARLKILTIKAVKAKIRYTAYTSDFGEAFRPSIPLWMVKASYAVVGCYIATDIAFEGKHISDTGGSNYEIGRAVGKATIFQGVASLAIPTIVIHSAVKYSRFGFIKYMPNYLKWGPSAVGLCFIPFLPFCDEPVEHAVDRLFEHVPKKSWSGENEKADLITKKTN
jgi:fission process protein 1